MSGKTWKWMARTGMTTPGAGTSCSRLSVRDPIMNGPLPTGWMAKLGVWASTASLGTIPKLGFPRMAGSDDCGSSRSKCTIWGDGVVMPTRLGASPSLLKSLNPVIPDNGDAAGEDDPFRVIRSNVKRTSSDVISLPLENLPPGRRVKSQWRWSGLATQLAAAAGSTAEVAGS